MESGAIVVHWTLRSERFPLDQIAKVQLRSLRDKHSYVYPLVHLILKDGRRVPFPDLRVSSLLIHRTVLAALGRLPPAGSRRH